MEDLERRIGYRFSTQAYLRRALTCQSAINERHSQASDKNYELLEFLGDAVLKYIITILLYDDSSTRGGLHANVCLHIKNENLTRIGRELNLERYIIRGRGVQEITDSMFAKAVEAILGAIIHDQRAQGNDPERTLCDVIARLFSIPLTGRFLSGSPCAINTRGYSCCKYLLVVLFVLISGILVLLVADHYEL